jgi:cytoskeletal protein RodZ
MIVIVALVVIAAALGVGWALGHRNNHANSGNSNAASGVTQPATQSSSSQSTTTTVATPLTPAELTQYDGYATALEKANGAASAGLASLGASPTVAGVTPLITSYLAALNLYNLQVHYVQWPASMQADVQADYAQLSAFLGFLPTLSAVTPTTLNAWLSQLHTVGGATQAADNRVRHTLGLTPSSSFP